MKVLCKDCVHYGICDYSPFSDKEIECKDFICKADYVEVVRCRDCKNIWGEVNQCCDVYCGLHKGWFDKDAFCSYGKGR